MIDFHRPLIRALVCAVALSPLLASAQKPARAETVTPVRLPSFEERAKQKPRLLGGNPRTLDGAFVFDGSTDGARQVDPQIAVGNGYVFHATNGGVIIYDKAGKPLAGTAQTAFGNGIDPKVYFDPHHRVFAFDVWHYFDKEKLKPVRISVSETDNPLGAWNTYAVSLLKCVDGGAIGYSRKWIGYSFPGGPEQTLVLSAADAKAGKPTTIYHFAGNLGHPVNTLDPIDDLVFFNITDKDFVVTRVGVGTDGAPEVISVSQKPHGMKNYSWPPQSPQKGTKQLTASGDRNPKNVVLHHGHLWFSHCIDNGGRAAVQWHELALDGTPVRSGLLSHPVNSYIQTSLAVNKNKDVLVGFQETGPDMFISPRFALLRADAPAKIITLGEGRGATDGTSWGDYSGACVDGDNLADLWTIQSITDAGGKGDTVIAKALLAPEKPAVPPAVK